MNNLIKTVKNAYPDCYVSIGLDVTNSSNNNESVEYTIVIYPDSLSMNNKIRQDFETYTALESYVNSLGKKDTIADIPEDALCKGKSNFSWWCDNCNTGVMGEHVTFQEYHDVRYGGCGCKVRENTTQEALCQ